MMRSGVTKRCILLLVCAIAIGSIGAAGPRAGDHAPPSRSALARADDSGVERPPVGAIETHTFKFFLDSALVEGLDAAEVSRRLSIYIGDINYIFAKNTGRSFSFDTATGLTITNEKPQTDSYTGDVPESGFEVWAHAVLTDYPEYGSYGGYMGFDSSGAGVAAGLKWAAVWDPDSLEDGSDDLRDYWVQIDHMVHEMEHVFGAGYSEYYGLNMVDDSTGVDPLLDIYLWDYPDDPYWSTHPDFLTDPLLINIWNNDLAGNPTTRTALLETVLFSDLSATICNICFRNVATMQTSLPDLANILVNVRSAGSLEPVQGADIKIWSVHSCPPYVSELIVDSTTDENGDLLFDWGVSYPFNNFDHLRLIKVYADGFLPAAQYVSVFDAQEARLLEGLDEMTVEFLLDINTPTLISSFCAALEGDEVYLTWELEEACEILGIRIYRDDGPVTEHRLIASLPPATRHYTDRTAEIGVEYSYVIGVVVAGREIVSPSASIYLAVPPVALAPNYPNPFNPTTTISFTIAEKSMVSLKIFDIHGCLVMTLIDRCRLRPDDYEILWDGRNTSGKEVQSGIYLLRLEAGKQTLSRKMVLMR
jgi:hypothetical protein